MRKANFSKCSLLRKFFVIQTRECHDGEILFTQRDHRFLIRGSCAETARRDCIGAASAWVTSDYVTSVPCRISRLPTALSRCWDNGSIRMDHDPGLDVPGTLEINARVMIPIVLFHRRCRRGNGSFLVHLSGSIASAIAKYLSHRVV